MDDMERNAVISIEGLEIGCKLGKEKRYRIKKQIRIAVI